jgi:hypothetical protein
MKPHEPKNRDKIRVKKKGGGERRAIKKPYRKKEKRQ